MCGVPTPYKLRWVYRVCGDLPSLLAVRAQRGLQGSPRSVGVSGRRVRAMTLGSARGAGVTLVDFQKALRAPRPTRSARPAPSSPPWRTGLGWREGAGGAAGGAETQPPPPHTMR